MLLLKNDHFTIDEKRYCLIEDRPQTNIAYIIALDDTRALPEAISLDELYRNAVPVDYGADQDARAARSRAATAAQIKSRDYAWGLIQPLTENASILEKGPRWSLIRQHARDVGASPVTILKHLKRYWQRGQSLDALLPDYVNCGKFNREKLDISGRPSTKPGRKNFIAREKDHQYFRNTIEREYLKDERKTIVDALQRLYERHYTYTDGNGEIFIRPPGERPTLRQFQYYLHKNYDLERRLRARRGDKNFEMNHRAILGTVAQQCRGVGHIYEIDATIADVTVVSSLNRADIIGRPTLYYVIDRHSRLIVGWYVGLESPSWSAALQAIFSIAQDKQVLCQRLDIEYDPEHWPAHGVMPENLYADRGEAMSNEAQKLCSALATNVVNLPSCRPDWKPLVEGRFKLIHQSIADSVPGYNPASNALRRRATDFSIEACLTIEEFEAIIVQSIITHNRSIMPAYELNIQQLADKVQPSPINIWNHSIASRSGQLTRHSENALRLALLPEARGSISGRGILVNGCLYMPTDGRQDLFIKGRQRRVPVQVTYDRRRADTVYVHDAEASGGYFVATLTPASEKYRGKSFDEVKQLQALEEALKSPALDERAHLRAQQHRFTDPLVQNARAEAKVAQQGASKTGRRQNIVEARAANRNIERDGITLLGAEINQSPEPTIMPSQNAAPSAARTATPVRPLIAKPKDADTPAPADTSNIVSLPVNQDGDSVPSSEPENSLSSILRKARARISGQASGAPL